MNTAQIKYILQNDPCTTENFAGVYACDQLTSAPQCYPAGYVVNTEPSTKSGEHWTAIFLAAKGKNEFYDSYGAPPDANAAKFLVRAGPAFEHNKKRIQGLMTTTCGQHCIFYLLLKCRGYALGEIVDVFSNDTAWNDSMVTAFVNKHFNVTTVPINVALLQRSLSKKQER